MKNYKKWAVLLIALSFISMGFSVAYAMPLTKFIGLDWWRHFHPAVLEAFRGGNPYEVSGFYSPPWLLLILSPLAILPIKVSTPLIFILNTAGYTWVAYKLGVNKYLILPLFFFSGALTNALKGNIDGILLLGLLMPSWLGSLFLMTKPQIGVPILLCVVLTVLFSKTSKREKIQYLFVMLAPLLGLTLLSFALYGNWYTHASEVIGRSWNAAVLWPYGFPLGIVLIWQSVARRDIRLALVSIPFVFPYISSSTWGIPIMGIVSLLFQRINFQRHPILKYR